MPLVKREAKGPVEVFDRFFPHWPEFFRRPLVMWPAMESSLIDVDEYTQNGTLVIRAEVPGIDPGRDVEITVEDDVLTISAERKEEETKEEKDYTRRELRYGSFRRSLPLPAGTKEDAIEATYKDGVLEIRLPVPGAGEEKPSARKIPVSTT